ncbi:Gcn1p NDAI_0B02720 [Naumovozyma dairenensis CBS 421]|uniref:eIF-2-alpha kinase activator GCN1 n=1 Tax=Naumovozyma dairenensis (strain ATCC 10597 / BCRC 20456 / CBS 421 / NBRC 0211 / NRRL Y-12639) TaxID=1071378 RepID=G0W696_NAUDC|nr:hypothetical protein NDAI_0B02720 [Naumovozyma dairenensis CBS 421]CCD23307.1 hypothetical protein NDAI_0B02720 [Naumovozyma dairenensis CBS 421]
MSSTVSWEELSPLLDRRCNDSLVSRRIPFLESLKKVIDSETLELPQLTQISVILLKTFMTYQDTQSKELVTRIFQSILKIEPRLLEKYSTFILAQVSKNPGTKAVSDYLNILDWVHAFLKDISSDPTLVSEYASRLLEAHTYTTFGIENVLDNQEGIKKAQNKRNQHRRRIRESVLQSTTKTFTQCFKSTENGVPFLEIVLQNILESNTKQKLPITGIVIAMGALTQSSMQLFSAQPALYNLLKEKYVEKYCTFLGKDILLAKVPPSAFTLEISLKPFVKEFVTEALFNEHFVPNMEKANLRAPELGFAIANELYSGVDAKKINLLKVFTSSKLMSQSFSSFKSSKEIVRELSSNSVITLLKSLNDETTEEPNLLKFIDEIFKNIKSNLNADYKYLVSKILVVVPTSSETVSTKIVQGLSTYITKEGKENALCLMLSAFFTHYFNLPTAVDDMNKIIRNGFKDKTLNIRKCWFTIFLEYSKKASPSLLGEFETDCLEFVTSTLGHLHKHDHKSLLGCLEYISASYTSGNKGLQDKVQNMIESLPESSALGDAFVTVALSTALPSTDRLHSIELLHDSFIRHPKLLGLSIATAVEKCLNETTDDLSARMISFKYIAPIFNSISQPIEDASVLTSVLIAQLIISQFTGFKLKNGWAGLVLQAKQDPATIVAAHAKQIIERIISITNDAKYIDTPFSECAFKAAAYTSFINPTAIAPLLSDLIKSDLAVGELPRLTAEDFEIWEGNENVMVVNILDKKMVNKLSDKNTKDYETLKWEQSIRKEQAKKNARKYTKEEQALVNEQLAKESEIRKRINSIKVRLHRAVKLIKQLSKESTLVDNGNQVWYPVAVNNLLRLAQEPSSSKLVNTSINDTFLALSDNFSDRLETMGFFIGLAILRVHKVTNIPENYLEEPLEDLLSRVLFRVKFVCNQKALDSISLTYLLPLLINVLEEGKRVSIKNADKPLARTEFVEEDKEEEHLLLAMEIISVHADVFEDRSIPRIPIISVLLSLLKLPSKAKIAKDCFNALCQSISVSPNQDDLDIILSNLLSPNQFVRSTILETLDNEFELEPFMEFSPEIFICRFESDESNKEIADFIWDFNKFKINDELITKLLTLFNQDDSGLRLFTAKAYAYASMYLAKDSASVLQEHLNVLLRFYEEKSKPLEAILDEFGLVVVSAAERKDPWQDRSTVAITLKEMAAGLSEEDDSIVNTIKFLVESGALGDREPLVRQEMKEAGIEVITIHGANKSEELIPIFEHSLVSDIPASIKENVIILYGTLARHLKKDDPRIHIIIDRLLATLDTPSSDVQEAVSECIAPLVFQFRSNVEGYIRDLMNKLLDPTCPARVRKGAAWGISGLVKGYGISALSEFDIIRNLMEAAEDKKESKRRESVALAFECLSKSLKKFFEPYVIEVLPNILKNLGDSVPEVRNATAEATKAIMGHTTSYGVKKLIPVAVSNLDEISWRTKRGSVELLGNMAYLDPTQLSSSLSTIVPEIVGVLNDSHKEVRKAADESLKRFGEVIRNPEIQNLVPVLLQAIGDPTKYTEDALDALIQTQFVHYIDGPSLALIIHVIHRGMHDRSANTKRKACKIVGNMAILVDTKDLIPYLQQLIDEVKIAMVDPVPNTRATAARALGALVERLGEEQFPDLIPRLLDTLSDEMKSGDRLGSAQALAEVISGLGLSKLDELLPTILAGVTNFRAYVREGFMPLLLFIPICFGAQFAPYINQIIQPILSGLADNDENIRDTSLKAGKLIVKNYATKAIDLLLPELERGMFDENDRIRLSSVQLTGELLFQVTGISARNEFTEEQEDYNTETSTKLVDVLGQDRRDRVLAALFVCRNDTSGIVRATTVDIWKALVPNTPRAVKEILPTLTSIIVTHLASSSNVLRNIAAQTLGDLVRRVGGNALSQLLPTLEESLEESSNSDSRQGVCIALHELIESSSGESLATFQDIIVNIIRKTLIDVDESVRSSAASAFDAYQNVVGNLAVDEIIPYLLHMLKSEDDSEYALLGLQDIMSTKSEVIFPILIPTLLASPIDAFRASALGSLAEVAGSALYKRLSTIVNAVVNALVSDHPDEETKHSLETTLDKIFLSVDEDEGLHPLLQQIMSLLKSDDKAKRSVISKRLPNFFEHTTLNLDIYVPDFVSYAILSLDDNDPEVVEGNFNALTALLKTQDKSMLEKLVKPAKQALALTGTQGEDLAAFKLPRGPNCVLPIFLHGLMYGSSDEREASALAIADVVSKTPSANLKPFVSVITGPLIRVVGERFSSDIKAAILFALNILFVKIPQFLRPFIPQLQRTFVKSLSDPSNETLRLRAAKALGTLIEYQPRVDPLVVELVTGAKQATDEGVKTAMLKALLEVIVKAGNKLNETSKNNVVNLVEEEMLSSNDKLAIAYAKLIGSLSEILSPSEAHKILEEKVLSVDLNEESGKFAILTLNSFLKDAPGHIFNPELIDSFVKYIINAISSTNPYFGENGIIAAGKLLLLENEKKSPFSKNESSSPFALGEENIKNLIDVLATASLQPTCNSADCRRVALVVIRTMARFKFDECVKPYITVLGLSVFGSLRDPIIPVKLAAEKAYLALFKLVEEPDMKTFNEWFSLTSSGETSTTTIVGTSIQFRSIGDFTKRVGKRLATVERDRIAAGGDAETMFSDRFEDEREIWAVGGVELNNNDI